MSNSLGDDAFCKNLTATTITDINGQTGLVGQVLSSTALGIDWVAGGGGGGDLQTTCNIGNTTNTAIIMTALGISQDPQVLISTSTAGNAIKIGHGTPSGALGTISIGTNTGSIQQFDFSIAIGEGAGTDQGFDCVAIGVNSGVQQSTGAVAIGGGSGQILQGGNSVAIGTSAGEQNQVGFSTAVGFRAGQISQQLESIAIGSLAGQQTLAKNAIAIGSYALQNSGNVGKDSIAIGNLAMDTPPQFDNNIILNATGTSFPDLITYPVATGGRCYIGSLRKDDGTHTAPFRAQPVFYDTLSGELFWT